MEQFEKDKNSKKDIGKVVKMKVTNAERVRWSRINQYLYSYVFNVFKNNKFLRVKIVIFVEYLR